MSLSKYALRWSDKLIQRVESRLRDVHTALLQHYEQEGYATRVTVKSSDGEQDPTTTMDVVSPVGSFLLRSCVHPVPFEDMHDARGVGADLVLTIPEDRCSLSDVQEGRYLHCRHAFLEEVEVYLKRLSRGTAKRHRRDEGDDEDRAAAGPGDGEHHAAMHRLRGVEVLRCSFGDCYGNSEKQIIRLRFPRASMPGIFELFHVDLHFRPYSTPGRAVSAAAIRKHPHYSYLILEDDHMPRYLKKLHEMCVGSQGLLRAVVLLKCWAHHVGLMAAASGHTEGLNGFIIAAMVLHLLEDAIVSPTMSEDNIVRAVWVHLAQSHFTQKGRTTGYTGTVPAAEERGEVAVLRFKGETMNILFRSSSLFFTQLVKPAAEEALQYPSPAHVFRQVAFQPLAVRHDVAVTLTHLEMDNGAEEVNRGAELLKCGIVSPLLQPVHRIRILVEQALGPRMRSMTVWRTGATSFQVAVQLSSEAEGRSRLSRGPPIEDAEAVSRFNTFWGSDVTTTRQFPDGAIYRCVLWTFTEDAGTNTTVALSASTVIRRVLEFAVRKHLAEEARVSVMLGGLEAFLAERIGAEWRDAAPLTQKSLLDATKEVQRVVADLPRSELPCKITGFDVIAASERHTEVFPIRPHFALTYTTDDLTAEAYTGISTAPVVEPVHCVLTIDDKHKIPDTMEAIAMMKGAISAQLAKTIQRHYGKQPKTRDDTSAPPPPVVRAYGTSQSTDIILNGYLFRVYVAHYREVSLLRALQRDTEANFLEQRLFWSVQHAKLLRSVSFGHHSYSTAVRLAKRWVSAMLLSEFVPAEAIELLVANAYLQAACTPKTPASGFLRFVQLLASHDWTTPLVLPYTDDDNDTAAAATLVRQLGEQQGMFIAAPYAPTESPFTVLTPRPMIMHRLVQLAHCVLSLLLYHVRDGDPSCELEAFLSNPSAFDFSMPFHPHLVLQPDRALRPMEEGAPSVATSSVAEVATADPTNRPLQRIWQLDELDEKNSRQYVAQFIEREPVAHAVRSLRAAFRDRAMLFYDALAPRALYVVTITTKPIWKQCRQLHNELLRESRGALLPSPPSVFTTASTPSADRSGDSTRCKRACEEKRKANNRVAVKKSGKGKAVHAASRVR